MNRGLRSVGGGSFGSSVHLSLTLGVGSRDCLRDESRSWLDGLYTHLVEVNSVMSTDVTFLFSEGTVQDGFNV